MARFESVTFLFVIFCCLIIVNADLTLSGAKCGTKICSDVEFCSNFDLLCKPCSDICDRKHHNFDESRCVKDCQNYLHEIRFLRNYNQPSDDNLRAEVQHLHYLVAVTLTLTCLILVALSIIAVIKIFRWRRKHRLTFAWLRSKLKLKEKSKSDRPTNTVAVTSASGKPELRLDMPPMGLQTPSGNGHTPSTATTTISRRPTEDNTLDYAYDNPVMVSTPSPNALSKPHESSL